MNLSFFPFAGVYLVGVLLSAAAQVLLKTEAGRKHKNAVREYINLRVILGYGIIFGVTVITLTAYRGGLPVSWGNVLESSGYFFVTLLGVVFLKEKVSVKKILALCVIMAGVVLFATGQTI